MARHQAFGPYQLVERIGVGSLGEVYRAIGPGGRVVALKRLMQSASQDRDIVEMLRGEAALASALDHPAIAKVTDVGEVNGVHFIAYEFVHGRDLRSIQARATGGGESGLHRRPSPFPQAGAGPGGERVPLDVALHVAIRVAEALAHAHTRSDAQGAPLGMVHRDISPTNIMVSFDGEVKLLDFGIARAAGRITRTGAGQVRGTLGYMSPEQVAGATVDARTDLYALGICLWELCVGRRLFEGGHAMEVAARIARGQVRSPRASGALISAELESILLKALAQSTSFRYPTAVQLQADLTDRARAEGLLTDSIRVARYVRSLFPEVAAEGAASPEESLDMADNKGGSDLDVFEGLAKKASKAATPGLAPPPAGPGRKSTLLGGLGPLPPPAPPPGAAPPGPPPAPPSKSPSLPPPMAPPAAAAPLPPPPGAPPKSSVAGLPPPPPGTPPALPAMPPPPAASALPAPLAPPSKGPPGPPPVSLPAPLPPPPSRAPGGSVPPSAPPPFPPAPSAMGAPPLPPPASAKPALPPPPGALPPPIPPPGQSIGSQLGVGEKPAKAGKASVDMDWDDEEESTHVYDKQEHGPRPTSAQPKVSAAAALLAGSGGTAAAVKSQAPPAAIPSAPPPPPPVPAIPAAAIPTPPVRNDEPTAVRPRASVPQASGGGSKAGVILGGLSLVVVLGLAVFMFLPKKGQIKVTVTARGGEAVDKAEIYIDGQKRCDTTPCIVTELAPGPKEIKVVSPGFPTRQLTETVEGNKEKVVALDLGGGSTPTSGGNVQAAAGGTELKAAAPEGVKDVKVSIDGADKGMLPLSLSDIAPGSHKIKFDAGERYEKLEQSIDIVAGQSKDLGVIKLKVVKGQVTLELATTGSLVTLVRRTPDGKKVEKKLPDALWRSPPVKIDVDPTESWKLVATKRGFDEFTQDLTFEDGQAEKTIKIELFETGKAASPQPLGTVAAVVNTAKPKDTPPPAATSGSGTLNINSIPVSKVILDGKPLGSTPKVGVSVSAGSHTVTFIHPELGKKSVTVQVKAGETKTAAVKFK